MIAKRCTCWVLSLCLVIMLLPFPTPAATGNAFAAISTAQPQELDVQSASSHDVVDVSHVLAKTLGTQPRTIPAATDFHEAFGVQYGYPAYNENFDTRVTNAGGDAAAQKAAVLAEDTELLDFTSLDAEGNLYKNGVRKEATTDGRTITKLVRHTYGASNYGETIPDSAPATNKRLSLRMLRYGNVVTGLYVPPGEVVKITLESSSSDTAPQNLGLKAYIGNFGGNSETVGIPATRNYVRMPNAEKTLTLDAADGVNYVGSPFGGALLIYSNGIGGTAVQMTVEGAVEMPTYFYGETSDEELARQLEAPGPYFAFSTPRGLRAVGPASLVRGKSPAQIKRAMEFWDKAIGLSYQFEAGSFDSSNPDTNLMVEMFEPYIPAGAAVNMGNYCICPVSWGESFLDGDGLVTSGAWGQIHELNHSFPWGGAIDGMTEISNNVINALTYQLYTNIAANRHEPTNRNDPSSSGLSGWNWTADLYTTVERLRLNAEALEAGKADLFPRWNLQVYVPLQHAFGADRFLGAVHLYHEKGGKYNRKLSGNALYTNSNVWMRAASEATGRNLGYYMRDVQGFPELEAEDTSQTDYITTDVRSALSSVGSLYIPSGCLYASGMAYEAVEGGASSPAGKAALVSGLGATDSDAFAADKEVVEMGRPMRIPAGVSKTLDFRPSTDGGYVSVAKGESVEMVGYTKPAHGTIAATSDALRLKYTPNGSNLEDHFYVTLKLTVTDAASPYKGRSDYVTFKVSLLQETSGFTTTAYEWTNPSSVTRGNAVAYAVENGATDQEPASTSSLAAAGFDTVPSGTLAVTQGKVYIPKTGAVELYVRGNYWFSTCVAASADALPSATDAQSKRDWPIGGDGSKYDTTAKTSRIAVYVVPAGESAPADASAYAAVVREGEPLYVRAYMMVNGTAGRYRIGYLDGSTVKEFTDSQVRNMNVAEGLSTSSIASFTREKLYSYPSPAEQSTTLYGDFVSVGEPLAISRAWDVTHDRDFTVASNCYGNNTPDRMLDDSLTTMFHGHTSGSYKAEFVFELAQPETFNLIRYKGHATAADRGKIKGYHVYVGDSLEAVSAADAAPVAEGVASQANDYGNFNKIELGKYVTAQYVRLVADDEYSSNGQYYIAFSDFRVGRLDSISGEGAVVEGYDTDASWQADDAFINTRTQLMSTTSGTGTFTFTGTGVIMYTAMGPDYGTMLVSVDGGTPVEVSQTATTLRGQQSVFWKSGLASGLHTVTFQPKTPGVDKVNVEYFEVKTTESVVPVEEPEPEKQLNVQLSGTRFAYTGAPITPDMTVMLDDEVISSGYTTTYDANENVGTAAVTVKLNRDGKDYEATESFEILKAAYIGTVSAALSGDATGWRYSNAVTAVPAPALMGAPAGATATYYYSTTYPEGMVDAVASAGLSDGSSYGTAWDAAAMNSATLAPDTYYLWAVVTSQNYSTLATEPVTFTVLPEEHTHVWGSPEYTWSGDLSSVTATTVCADNVSHVLSRTVSTTYTVTAQPTYSAAGAGTYTATFEAPFATQTKTVEVPALVRQPITVAFDANGGTADIGSMLAYEASAYGQLPNATRDGWIFEGWFTAADGGDEVTSTMIVPEAGDHTLYAHWAPTATVEGQVITGSVSAGDQPVKNAQVQLRRGSTVVGTAETNDQGTYAFPLVAYGTYNVVLTATVSGEDEPRTLTTLVNVDDSTVNSLGEVQVDDLALPDAVTDSVLQLVGDGIGVVVGRLDELASDVRTHAESAASAGATVSSVTVTMTVSAVDEWEAVGSGSVRSKAVEMFGQGKDVALTCYDVQLQREITTSSGGGETTSTESIANADTVMEIVVPYAFGVESNLAVYRYHDGEASVLERFDAVPSEPIDGSYVLDYDAQEVHIYASAFSTYAIGAVSADEPYYVWADDDSGVTASRRVYQGADSSVETETVDAIRTVTVAADCEAAGQVELASAAFANSAFTVQRKMVEVPALGHEDDGGKVTVEMTDDQDGLRVHTCTRCDTVLSSEVLYRIVLNGNGVWTKGGLDSYVFASSATMDKFVRLLVDGTVVLPGYYDAESGSTKISLHPDFLNTLAAGVHTATVESTDGSASTTFIVQASDSIPIAEQPSAQTQPQAPAQTQAQEQAQPQAQTQSQTAERAKSSKTGSTKQSSAEPGKLAATGDALGFVVPATAIAVIAALSVIGVFAFRRRNG